MTSAAPDGIISDIMLEVVLFIVNGLLGIFVLVGFFRLHAAFKAGKPPIYTSALGQESELPSVTVCIPARNEAHALIDCLQRVVSSDYDKLEIIVLDDVSGDDTSALIKSFASEGVRFLKGSPLAEGWLGKNHALQGLLEQASGTYIFFMDVDTRLSPKAVENSVRYAFTHRKTMVSILPRREDGWRASVLFSPLRYFWELLLSRQDAPATASNAWLIRRETLLQRFGGFAGFKDAVQPEAKLAAELAKTNEYSFLVSSKQFGIGYEKKWRSQLITSVRLLFPLLEGRAWLVTVALMNIFLALIPFCVVVVAYVSELEMVSSALFGASLLVSIAFCSLYGYYASRVWRHGWLVGGLMWLLILVQEAILIISSAYQYSRRTVKWKGRLIRPVAQK